MAQLAIGFASGLFLWLIKTVWDEVKKREDRAISRREAQQSLAIALLQALMSESSFAARSRAWEAVSGCNSEQDFHQLMERSASASQDFSFVVFTLGQLCKLEATGNLDRADFDAMFGGTIDVWRQPIEQYTMQWLLDDRNGLRTAAERLSSYWSDPHL